MDTIIENFEATEDGALPPQELPVGYPGSTWQFRTMYIFMRSDVAHFVGGSAGVYLKGNLIALPMTRAMGEFGGGMEIVLRKPALDVSLDLWVAGLGEPGREAVRISYYDDDAQKIDDVIVKTMKNSYWTTVKSPYRPGSRKFKYLVIQAASFATAFNHVVMTVE